MSLRKSILFLFAIIQTTYVFSQRQPTPQQMMARLNTATEDDKFDAAQQLMEQKQWMHALLIWKNMLEKNPEQANYNYLAGVCQINLNLGKKDALPYLEKALKNISKAYDPFDFMEDRAPLETYFHLGKAYHLNYQFDKAIEYYTKFKTDGPKKHYLITTGEVDHQINISNNAKEYIANTKENDYRIYNIGGVINSEFSDFSPVVSLGEDILFFTSRRMRKDSLNADYLVPDDGKLYEDIYFSIKGTNDSWSDPHLVNISKEDENEATISVSADGTRLFVYHDDEGDGNIYETFLEDTAFSELNSIKEINTTAWETHCTMTPDGNTIYFVSDRDGGMGGRDIYRITKLPNGKWSDPMNVGAPINSKYDEEAPFIHADGVSLYFSSNNDKSMGGFDIYVSQLNEENKFIEPVNMGHPLNTVDDDVFFILNASGKRGYYSSAIEGGFGEKDIYVVEFNVVYVEPVAVLKGFIHPKKGEPLPDNILIYVTDLTEGDDPKEYRPNSLTNSYVLDLKPCHEYQIDYQRDGETFHEFTTQVPCEAGIGNINHEIYIDPIYLDPDQAVVVEEKSKQWHIISKGKLPTGDLNVKMMDANGNEFFNDPVRDGYFKYRELPDGKTPLFMLTAGDKPLCDELEIELVDENNKVVGKTIRDERCRYIYDKVIVPIDTPLVDTPLVDTPIIAIHAEPTSYEQYYTYNKKDIKKADKAFQKFINEVELLIKANGKVDMVFESSASKVPTTTYKTNENLTLKRAEDAKTRVFEALKAKKVDTSKVNIVAYSTLVQGPEYNDDWKTNKETYEKYQYIKINAK
jgi:tetratricopeptide (TPR) repeat protein